MTKKEFLAQLRRKLSGLAEEDVTASVEYYDEIISDKVENGKSEEEAVSELGEVSDVANKIIAETPLAKIVKERVKPKKALRGWEIALIAIGSPIWLSLCVAAVAVAVALYAVLWALVAVVWALAIAFAAVGAALPIYAVIMLIDGGFAAALACIGCGAIFIGLSIPLFRLAFLSVRGVGILSWKILVAIKSAFIRKEERA